jgi:hypothetical protein
MELLESTTAVVCDTKLIVSQNEINSNVLKMLKTPDFMTYMLINNPLRRIKLHDDVIGLWAASKRLRETRFQPQTGEISTTARQAPTYVTFHVNDVTGHATQFCEMLASWAKPISHINHEWRATYLGGPARVGQNWLKSSNITNFNTSADIRAWINHTMIAKLVPMLVVAVPQNAQECAFALICGMSILGQGGDMIIQFAHINTAVLSIMRACIAGFQEISIEGATPYLVLRHYNYLSPDNIVKLYQFIDKYDADTSLFAQRFYDDSDTFETIRDLIKYTIDENTVRVLKLCDDFQANKKSKSDESANWIAEHQPPGALDLIIEDSYT